MALVTLLWIVSVLYYSAIVSPLKIAARVPENLSRVDKQFAEGNVYNFVDRILSAPDGAQNEERNDLIER